MNGRCPYCDSADVVKTSNAECGVTDDGKPSLSLPIICNSCAREWNEIYILDHSEGEDGQVFEEVDDGPSEVDCLGLMYADDAARIHP